MSLKSYWIRSPKSPPPKAKETTHWRWRRLSNVDACKFTDAQWNLALETPDCIAAAKTVMDTRHIFWPTCVVCHHRLLIACQQRST